jgi:hypothetical protein
MVSSFVTSRYSVWQPTFLSSSIDSSLLAVAKVGYPAVANRIAVAFPNPDEQPVIKTAGNVLFVDIYFLFL